MDLQAGALFARLSNRREPPHKRHTWVIVSDPLRDAERVLLVNFTDADYRVDGSCEFQPDEHSCFTKRSRAAYQLAEAVTLDYLRAEDADGLLEPRGRLSEAQLKRVRLGAYESIHIADEHPDLLEAQGLGRDDLD